MGPPLIFCLGASLMFGSVAAGAFAAHALAGTFPAELLAVFHTAVQYQAWHALGLLAIAVMLVHWPGERGLVISAGALLVGVALFSGSLDLYVLSGARVFAMFTPLGGTALLTGWAILAVTAFRRIRLIQAPPAAPLNGGEMRR